MYKAGASLKYLWSPSVGPRPCFGNHWSTGFSPIFFSCSGCHFEDFDNAVNFYGNRSNFPSLESRGQALYNQCYDDVMQTQSIARLWPGFSSDKLSILHNAEGCWTEVIRTDRDRGHSVPLMFSPPGLVFLANLESHRTGVNMDKHREENVSISASGKCLW